jgi:hypothetical protein
LAKQHGFKDILLIEQESSLLSRASYHNQARVHNGYHYPRSFTTAYRSRVNLPKFTRDWQDVIKRDFTKLYAIARFNSKITAKQFERFCIEIGAKVQVADPMFQDFFEKRLIKNVFLVEEYVFDARKLADWANDALKDCGVQVRLNTQVTHISRANHALLIGISPNPNAHESIPCRYVFNCTYSRINQFQGDFSGIRMGLKHEMTEMPLLQVPVELQNLGITVMDGPFFSLMPFPARGLHALSHVRYTPHLHWNDESGIDPDQKLKLCKGTTRVERMFRDVGRYLPSILNAKYVDSLFEIKTVLLKNEGDDGRPILFEKHSGLPGCYSILGGKIDNIYDVFEKLDAEFSLRKHTKNTENMIYG